MRKILFLTLLLFLVVLPKQFAFADESSQSALVSPMVTTTNYTLPYPGILPDNPLYVFKTFRDALVTFFISDPLRKSAFYLLQSDKRLEASWYLLKEGSAKNDLALTTLSKSTNYMSLAIDQLKLARQMGEDDNAQKDSIANAITKHIDVVNTIVQDKSLSNRKGFMQELQRVRDLQKVVSNISSK